MRQLIFNLILVGFLYKVAFLEASKNSTCGIRPLKVVPGDVRIAGGRKAPIGSWPWMASLFYKGVDMRFCGAVIVESQWILTAAHCLDFNLDNNNWEIEVGRYNVNHRESFTRKYDVIKVLNHPEFGTTDQKDVYNDISLLKINSSINFNAFELQLNALCPADWDVLDGQPNLTCYTAGWGLDKNEGDSPEFLKEVRLPLVNSDTCFEKFQFKFDTNTQICAGGTKGGGEGTCYGDSGGPLQCLMGDIWYLVGLTAYGKPCALPGVPDVFTKVPAFYKWIYQTIQEN